MRTHLHLVLPLALLGCAPRLPAVRSELPCIEIEPMPGYRTCAIAEPQFSYGALPAGVSVANLDPMLPAAVDLRTDPALADCLVVEDQGQTSWCQTVSTTTALEAAECIACEGARAADPELGPARVSILHARWELFRNDPPVFTRDHLEAGTTIVNAAAMLLERGAAGEDELASLFELNAINEAIHGTLPRDARYAIQHRAAGMTVLPPGERLVNDLRAALAERAVPVVGLPYLNHIGWNQCDAHFGDVDLYPGAPRSLADVPSCTPGAGCDASPPCLVRGVQTDDDSAFHAVALVGYDDGARTFTVLNSWGTAWGHGGFGTVSYELVARWGRYGVTIDGMHESVAGTCDATPPTLDRCRAHTASCGTCTADPGCGWCSDANTCVEAVEGQGAPRHGQCSEWYGTQLECVAPVAIDRRPACPAGSCDRCVRIEGCGYRADEGRCYATDSVDPTFQLDHVCR